MLIRKGSVKKLGAGTNKKLKGGTPGHNKVGVAMPKWVWYSLLVCVYTMQSMETVVFKSYDKSSGVSLRSSKVRGRREEGGSCHGSLCVYNIIIDEDSYDTWTEESQDY